MSQRVAQEGESASPGRDTSCGSFFSSRRRHTRLQGDWSSDVCSSDLGVPWVKWRERDQIQQKWNRIDQRDAKRQVIDGLYAYAGKINRRFLPGISFLIRFGEIGRASCRERG